VWRFCPLHSMVQTVNAAQIPHSHSIALCSYMVLILLVYTAESVSVYLSPFIPSSLFNFVWVLLFCFVPIVFSVCSQYGVVLFSLLWCSYTSFLHSFFFFFFFFFFFCLFVCLFLLLLLPTLHFHREKLAGYFFIKFQLCFFFLLL